MQLDEVASAYLADATAKTRSAVAELNEGRPIVVVDRLDAESYGLLVMAAERMTADRLRSLTQTAGGAVYLALTDERCERLGLELVADRDDTIMRAPRTMTISARDGIETGVSLEEHAKTINVAISPESRPKDIVVGGHVHPLRARPGGILERAGWTEACVDLAQMAGLNPSAMLAEILLADGTEPRGSDLVTFARDRGMALLTIGELIAYRRSSERLVDRVVEASLPTPTGTYKAVGYADLSDRREHLALVLGDVAGQQDVLVYTHLACWEGDVFRSVECDCRARLDAATRAISDAGLGVILHLARDNRDRHQERRHGDHIRDFGIGAQILAEQGLTSLRVLTDNARPLPGLEGFGLSISGYHPLLGTTEG